MTMKAKKPNVRIRQRKNPEVPKPRISEKIKEIEQDFRHHLSKIQHQQYQLDRNSAAITEIKEWMNKHRHGFWEELRQNFLALKDNFLALKDANECSIRMLNNKQEQSDKDINHIINILHSNDLLPEPAKSSPAGRITFRLPPSAIANLNTQAAAIGKSTSALIRDLLSHTLTKDDSK